MAKQVSSEKLKKIEARGSKRRANKETRQTNRAKKFAARKGITEDQAKDIKANRKQRRLEKFETAMGIRQGVTTAKIGLESARKKMQENKINTIQETAPSSETDFAFLKKVSPFTKRTSCKY